MANLVGNIRVSVTVGICGVQVAVVDVHHHWMNVWNVIEKGEVKKRVGPHPGWMFDGLSSSRSWSRLDREIHPPSFVLRFKNKKKQNRQNQHVNVSTDRRTCVSIRHAL